MVSFDVRYDFLLVCYSNLVTKIVIKIFNLWVYSDLETWVRGHSRSSEPARIDLPPMTSY